MRTEQANRHSTRYIIEHWLLPKLVIDSGRDFITKLLKDKESFMFFISINYFNKEGVGFPYSIDQYKYESAQLADDAYLVTLTMPEPEEDMECYRIHILFDAECSRFMYFATEKDERSETGELCGWNTDDKGELVHIDYGKAGGSTDAERAQIIKVSGIFDVKE